MYKIIYEILVGVRLRGAIEVQASKNREAVRGAKEREEQRMQLSKEVREEIERYLQ